MNFQIRVVKPEELDTVLDLLARIFPYADPEISEDDIFLLAESCGKLVGFAHVIEDDEGVLLQGIGVEESIRCHGVGSALIEKVLEIFSDSDKTIFLKANMSNPALELYERFGFKIKRFGSVHILERKRET